MKIFCLRTVCETRNLGFDTEGVLKSGAIGARLTRQCALPESTYKIDGITPDGKSKVVVTTVDRTYIGQPLLLEIFANKEYDDRISPALVRPELESLTAELAATLTWSLSGILGVMLSDALFNRPSDGPPNEWQWFDVSPITVDGYYASLTDLKSKSKPLKTAF